MKRIKKRVSLYAFLKTGRFGPLIPKSDLLPETIISLFGKPTNIELKDDQGKYIDSEDYLTSNWEIGIISFGCVEFHYAPKNNLFLIFYDEPFLKEPWGGNIKLTDVALCKIGRPMKEFVYLAEQHKLSISVFCPVDPGRDFATNPITPEFPPIAYTTTTEGGVELHFEYMDKNIEPTLAAFYLNIKNG